MKLNKILKPTGIAVALAAAALTGKSLVDTNNNLTRELENQSQITKQLGEGLNTANQSILKQSESTKSLETALGHANIRIENQNQTAENLYAQLVDATTKMEKQDKETKNLQTQLASANTKIINQNKETQGLQTELNQERVKLQKQKADIENLQQTTIRLGHNVKIAESIAPSTCAILGSLAQGTGFFISAKDKSGKDKILVITNEHVTSIPRRFPMFHPDGKMETVEIFVPNALKGNSYGIGLHNGSDFEPAKKGVTAKLVTTDKDLDLAILELEGDHKPKTLPLRSFLNPVKVGEECHLFGLGGIGQHDRYHHGQVTHINRKTPIRSGISFETNAAVNNGASGSALVIPRIVDGKIIPEVSGVIWGGNPQLNNVGWGIDIYDLKMFLEKKGYSVMTSEERRAWHELEMEKLKIYFHPTSVTSNWANMILTHANTTTSSRDIELKHHLRFSRQEKAK